MGSTAYFPLIAKSAFTIESPAEATITRLRPRGQDRGYVDMYLSRLTQHPHEGWGGELPGCGAELQAITRPFSLV